MLNHSAFPGKRLQDSPLELHLRTFTTWLTEQGYAPRTVQLKLGLLADLGEWLGRSGLAVTNVDEPLLKTFAEHERPRVRDGHLKTLQQFLSHLRERGAVPEREPLPDPSSLAKLLGQYERHLHSERGLMSATISHYLYFVHTFLEQRFPKGPILTKELKASDISAFVLRHCQSRTVGTVHQMTTALRCFFRYLFQRGELVADLAASVPAVANRRLSTAPKYISPQEVERVLQSCNRGTAVGRRDYAILLLLAHLGLRAGEVAALELQDIRWRAGEILVRGKGRVHERMPLPALAGEALASYLRQDRPPCQARRVFIRTQAPCRGFAHSQAVTEIVRRALKRANVHPASRGAAHLFRHGVATFMLRSGATMREVGEVLRHRDPNTTAIYAKVDFEGLRSLAQPWPIGDAQ